MDEIKVRDWKEPKRRVVSETALLTAEEMAKVTSGSDFCNRPEEFTTSEEETYRYSISRLTDMMGAANVSYVWHDESGEIVAFVLTGEFTPGFKKKHVYFVKQEDNDRAQTEVPHSPFFMTKNDDSSMGMGALEIIFVCKRRGVFQLSWDDMQKSIVAMHSAQPGNSPVHYLALEARTNAEGRASAFRIWGDSKRGFRKFRPYYDSQVPPTAKKGARVVRKHWPKDRAQALEWMFKKI